MSGFKTRVHAQALLLGLFALVSTALLVAGDLATRDAIQERQREDLLASLAEVVPPEIHDNDLLNDVLVIKDKDRPVTVYRGLKNGHVSALAWEVVGKGYAGDIRILMAVDPEGRILGVRVLQHAETPGLGDNIEADRSDWILRFNGLSLGDPPPERWKVKKDGGVFDAFSGATITPRGVVAAIKAGLEFFQAHRAALLRPSIPPQKEQIP